MPRGPAPYRRKEPIMDTHIRASIAQANGSPDPETGFYATLHYAGIETEERAKEIRRALFRSARHEGVSVKADVHQADDGTYFVPFTAISKQHARAYVVNTYGTDRGGWAYDPYHRPSQDE